MKEVRYQASSNSTLPLVVFSHHARSNGAVSQVWKRTQTRYVTD